MGDNKCKNENNILELAKSVIKDTITKDTNPIIDIFSYTFKESLSTATENYNQKITSHIILFQLMMLSHMRLIILKPLHQRVTTNGSILCL
jgi:hypothetical protein